MSDIAQRAALDADAAPYRWRWAAFAVVLRLGDIYGRRRVLLAGMAGFTMGSILCGIATQPGELIAFRVVQGLFGAIMLPQGLGVIRASFPPRELPAAFGAFGPVMGLSSVGGPVLAGWLIDADYFGMGWRMIFLVNAPIGLAAFLAGLRFLPRAQQATASRLDIVGAVLVAVAAGLVVYPVVQGREPGWPAWTFLLMAASAVVFAAAGAGLAARLGRALIHVGTAAIALGLAGVYLTLHEVTPPLTPWQLAPALALSGIGMGLVLAPFFDIILAGVEPAETGSASGTLTAIQQFGSALGAAVLGTVFFDLLTRNLHTHAGQQAFTRTLGQTLWVAVALQAATFALAFLLPQRARPQWNGVPDPGDGTGKGGGRPATPAAESA